MNGFIFITEKKLCTFIFFHTTSRASTQTFHPTGPNVYQTMSVGRALVSNPVITKFGRYNLVLIQIPCFAKYNMHLSIICTPYFRPKHQVKKTLLKIDHLYDLLVAIYDIQTFLHNVHLTTIKKFDYNLSILLMLFWLRSENINIYKH